MNPLARLRARRSGMLSCRQVGKALQAFLDGEVDEITAEKVAAHLEECRRCGMASEVYLEIKASIARAGPTVPETTLWRLRRFGQQLSEGQSPDGHNTEPMPEHE